MAEVLYTNIFFFITGIGVIVLTVFLSVALFHLIKILTSVRRIVERLEAGAETLIDDIEDLRTYVMEESFLARFFHAVVGKRKRARPPEPEETPAEEERAPRRERRERKYKTELRIKNHE